MKRRTLAEELAELERTNPEVAAAAQRLDDVIHGRLSYRERARRALRQRKEGENESHDVDPLDSDQGRP